MAAAGQGKVKGSTARVSHTTFQIDPAEILGISRAATLQVSLPISG